MWKATVGAHDYGVLHESIKRYYPSAEFAWPGDGFFLYPESDEWRTMIADKATGRFEKMSWGPFVKKLKSLLPQEVRDTTAYPEPSFSAVILLEKTVTGDLTREKHLYILLSHLGPFYAIYGADMNTVSFENKHYYTLNMIVASPLSVYEQAFHTALALMAEHFPAHKQVPWAILQQPLKTADGASFSVLEALFRPQYGSRPRFFAQGEVTFGMEAWQKPGMP